MAKKNTKNVSVLKQYFDLDPELYAVLCGLSLEEATPIANKRVCEALASRALVNLDGVCPNAGYLRCRLTTAGTVTLQAAKLLLSDPTPMQPGAGTESLDDEITSEVVRGLARMEDHLEAENCQIEEHSKDLLDTWPVQEALDQLYEIAPVLRQFEVPDEKAIFGDIDPRYVLGILAGRCFLAGLEAARRGRAARSSGGAA
jgi:hypothetical protein